MTTNGEWLFSKPFEEQVEEQVAWMNAEHQDGSLDGDTEPENGDSRELILTDLENKTREWHDYDGNFMRIYSDVAYAQMKELLDRQAAITERDCRKPNWSYCETCEALEKLTAERDELNSRAERTCHIEGGYYDELMDEHYTQLSCDHETSEYEPNYCPTCGARIVGRDDR